MDARICHSSPFTTDATCQLDILGHDGDPLGMDGADVGVLEQPHQVSLACLLNGHDSRSLEAKISLEILGDFPDKPLERPFPQQQFGRLLVPSDLPQCNSAGPEPVRLFHPTRSRSTLPCSFGSQLLPGSLPSSGLASSLLSSCHPGDLSANDDASKQNTLLIVCLNSLKFHRHERQRQCSARGNLAKGYKYGSTAPNCISIALNLHLSASCLVEGKESSPSRRPLGLAFNFLWAGFTVC